MIGSPTAPTSPENPGFRIERSRSPKRNSKDSGLSGTTCALTALTDSTKWNASTFSFKSFAELSKEAELEIDELLPEMSAFKLDAVCEEELEAFDGFEVRSPSPLDPELVFDIERVYISVSGFPKGSRQDCQIEDLTGKVIKLFEHPSAMGGCSDIWKGRLRPEGGGQIFVSQ